MSAGLFKCPVHTLGMVANKLIFLETIVRNLL